MEQVNTKKIFKYDGQLRMTSIFVIFAVALGIYLSFFYEEDTAFVGWIFLGLSGAALILSLVRYFYLISFNSKESVVIDATVTKIFYYRGTKRITFIYNIEGIEYKKVNVVNYTKTTREIQKDQNIKIRILVDNPKFALIKDLYFDETEL